MITKLKQLKITKQKISKFDKSFVDKKDYVEVGIVDESDFSPEVWKKIMQNRKIAESLYTNI